MASLKPKFLDGCAANGVSPGCRRPALEGHGVLAGLLLQQGAFRLLRAHRLPHRLAEGQPSVRVHGRADLERDEHEGRVPIYVNACDEMGIDVLPPDVNESQVDFAVRDGKIRFGLNAVKNVGETAALRIVAARDAGDPFTSIWDFTERVDPQVVNKRSLESLVKCGALDSTGQPNGDARRARAGALARAEARGRSADGASVDLRPRLRRARSRRRSAPTHHPRGPGRRVREVGAAPGWRRRRSACTCRSIRSPRCATSCDGRPMRRSGDRATSRRRGRHRRGNHLRDQAGDDQSAVT